MKKILFIVHEFYPSAKVGAKRIGKLCKLLPSMGYFPVILTVKKNYYDFIDDQLAVENARVYRTPSLTFIIRNQPNYFKYLFGKLLEKKAFPDRYIGWIPFAFTKALHILRQEKIDFIITSGPPFSSFLLGALLKNRYRIPLIVEYRDPWSLSYAYRQKFRNRLHRFLDHAMLKFSDGQIFASEGYLADYQKIFPGVDFSNSTVIRNAYDPDIFRELKEAEAPEILQDNNQFVITYAGSFYGPRKPDTFLAALSQLRAEGKISENNFRFVCLGNMNQRSLQMNGIGTLIDFRGIRPYKETLRYLAGSDTLLVVVGKGYDSNIPAKVYDYLAIGKPLLVVCPKGASVENIVKETGCGYVADVENPEDIKLQLYRMMKQREKIRNDRPSPDLLNQYTIQTMTRRLADYLSTFNEETVTYPDE